MRADDYNVVLVRHALDLFNRPPADAADLSARWLAVCTPPDYPIGDTDLRDVRAYLAGLPPLIDAAGEPGRVAYLNTLLARYATPPSVSDHDGAGWHMHYRPERARHGTVFTAATTVATAQFLTAHGMHRLGRCALPECANAFADITRPGRQRYCSHPCANRDAVRRHRLASRRG